MHPSVGLMDHETKKKNRFRHFFLDVEFDIGLRREGGRKAAADSEDSELRSPILFHSEQRKCVWAVRPSVALLPAPPRRLFMAVIIL